MKDNKDKINELARKLKNGDNSAFEELYKLTSPKAYFIALQICGDKHEAEDIVQESYVSALAKISALEKTESFMSWFNRIVANKSKDHLRKKNPLLFAEGEERELDSAADDIRGFSLEDNVDRDELRDAVMDAIKELAVEKRTCVLMKYFDDMSVNEIAKSMEIPVSTVKNRLLAARRELKSLFEKKGITAAYSVAPFGVVSWAFDAAFEAVAQSFEGSAAAAKIFSGIAVAGTAAAATATATAGTAAGSGIFAKAAAATTMQKVVSGLVVAGVVTGSTIGITTAVKNKTPEVVPTTSYTETVDYAVSPEPEVIPAVNEVNADLQENSDEYETKILDFDDPEKISKKANYKGSLKLGNNNLDFDDGVSTYYVDFNVEKAGFYMFTCDYEDVFNFVYVFVPEDSQSERIIDYYEAEIHTQDGKQFYYLEEGEKTIIVTNKIEGLDSTDIAVEYLGEEISDIVIEQEDLDNVVLDYDEYYCVDGIEGVCWQDQSVMEEGAYGNRFRTKIIFSSGKVYDMGEQSLRYRIKDGGELKEGKNTVIFAMLEYYNLDKEFEITVRPVIYYVKDIEVSNLGEFTTAQIGEDGFVQNKPENYEVTVTYADGSKETFDGASWDGFLRFDHGVELKVIINRARETGSMDYRLRSREPLRFTVSIGDTYYIDEICIVDEFDVIGYRKRLDENNLEEVREYTVNIEDGIEQMKENTDSVEDFLWYSTELSKITGYNSYKIVKRIAGFELDYAITTYKIITENEFDLKH